MEVTGERAGFRDACEAARLEGGSVGLVPTMGFLHDGHLSLVERARKECGPGGRVDLRQPAAVRPGGGSAAYPRDLDRDLAHAGAGRASTWCSRRTPTRCIRTVVPGVRRSRAARRAARGSVAPRPFPRRVHRGGQALLAGGPGRAYFGEKDAQQLAVIRRMVVGPGQADRGGGLSDGSRGGRAGAVLAEHAPGSGGACRGHVPVRGAARAAWLVEGGERDARCWGRDGQAHRRRAAGQARLRRGRGPGRSRRSTAGRPARALVAARIGNTRLIDNLALSIEGNRPGGSGCCWPWTWGTPRPSWASSATRSWRPVADPHLARADGGRAGADVRRLPGPARPLLRPEHHRRRHVERGPERDAALREMVHRYFPFDPVVVEPGSRPGCRC